MTSTTTQVSPGPRNLVLVLAGQIVTVLGSSLLRFALSLYVLDLTKRADVFAGILALSSLPMLLAPIGGAISDRSNRQRLMVAYDAVCCVVAVGLVALLASGRASVVVIGLAMVLFGLIGAMETPNTTACVPQLVSQERLTWANGLVQAVQSASGVLAPVLGGILYSVMGITELVGVGAVAFGLAAATETFIRLPHIPRPRSAGIARTIAKDLAEGFRFTWSDRLVRKLMIAGALLNLIVTSLIIIATPLILRTVVHASDSMYGVGMAVLEVSTILGALGVGLVSKRMHMNTLWRWVLAVGLVFIPAGFFVTPMIVQLGFWPPFLGFMACAAAVAIIATILSIFVIVRVQTQTAPENLGKVMAILMAVAQCAIPLGQVAYGLGFQGFAGQEYVPILFAGAATVIMAVVFRPLLRREK
ncbi:MAG: MFS transporter [Propionibacteriaceae bacterium]|jgi:MFS family permease|nr:MFS transporter [Propionibacteriaceae bacterium]